MSVFSAVTTQEIHVFNKLLNIFKVFSIFISGNCTGEISSWQLDQKMELCDGVESVLTLNSKISVHNDCVNGVRLVIINNT